MLTPDQIRNVEFNRGRGYRAEDVDEFIDNCVETVEALLRDKEELSQKMQVLAEKVVEYRNEEDSIRSAVLSAQRTGDKTIREAEEKAAAIIGEAEAKAADIHAEMLKQVEAEKQELDRIKQEVTAFKTKLMTMYREHLAQIGMLPAEENAAEQPTEETVEEAFVEPDGDEDMIIVPDTEEEKKEETDSRFSNLKFGEDYNISEDDDEFEEDEEEKRPRGLFKKRK